MDVSPFIAWMAGRKAATRQYSSPSGAGQARKRRSRALTAVTTERFLTPWHFRRGWSILTQSEGALHAVSPRRFLDEVPLRRHPGRTFRLGPVSCCHGHSAALRPWRALPLPHVLLRSWPERSRAGRQPGIRPPGRVEAHPRGRVGQGRAGLVRPGSFLRDLQKHGRCRPGQGPCPRPNR